MVLRMCARARCFVCVCTRAYVHVCVRARVAVCVASVSMSVEEGPQYKSLL